jgi:hypothetical protein
MAVAIYFTVQDSDGDKSTFEFWFPETTPFGALAAGVPAIAALVNPLVNGGLVTAGFKVEIDISVSWGPIAALISDVQEKAEFSMRTVNGFLTRLNLPTFDENFFVVGTGDVDVADPDVAAFIDFLEDGITVGGELLEPSSPRGSTEDVATVERAVENWGKRRR